MIWIFVSPSSPRSSEPVEASPAGWNAGGVSDNNQTMKYSEFKRWLAKHGARFRPGNGSHLHVELNGKYSVFPFHGSKEIPTPLVKAIKKDLGLD